MKILKDLYDQMILQGSEALPYETCGLLTGEGPSDIQKLWPLENEWKSPHRFYVSKKVVEETLKRITAIHQTVLGVYHSHPTTAPVPSFYDLKNHPDDDIKMMIISYKNIPPTVKCYSIKNRTYDEHPFSIE
ncbi:M67 family metallopeptidase [Halobacillus sp. Nhm2S1]|uniref:M67 family metallopeptidase n=1 Tax=Halobacillus sp. Nhm2S1 TaxID=2866716 RepID=UPI001C73A3F7|nr:M67 family metallopeptidase [Halobacillus sp. Nhm2S1]MBX0356616.1 M67 family metallopeptidase [Halobacillus sp. Nhm2S1]